MAFSKQQHKILNKIVLVWVKGSVEKQREKRSIEIKHKIVLCTLFLQSKSFSLSGMVVATGKPPVIHPTIRPTLLLYFAERPDCYTHIVWVGCAIHAIYSNREAVHFFIWDYVGEFIFEMGSLESLRLAVGCCVIIQIWHGDTLQNCV